MPGSSVQGVGVGLRIRNRATAEWAVALFRFDKNEWQDKLAFRHSRDTLDSCQDCGWSCAWEP